MFSVASQRRSCLRRLLCRASITFKIPADPPRSSGSAGHFRRGNLSRANPVGNHTRDRTRGRFSAVRTPWRQHPSDDHEYDHDDDGSNDRGCIHSSPAVSVPHPGRGTTDTPPEPMALNLEIRVRIRGGTSVSVRLWTIPLLTVVVTPCYRCPPIQTGRVWFRFGGVGA